jgi:hypothetical protein
MILRKIRKLSGIEYLSKCVNDADFATMDNIEDISQKHLICVKDVGDNYYAFDIRSLAEYISTTQLNTYRWRQLVITNPFNRQEVPNAELVRIAEFSK